ncbi:bifunctional serine/threonine-protein kinase/ABC transporter substrate-binding protein [Streptomyces sp. NPDC049906]|uniref:bifunctional serine/threonine-protein kinase/ABC transporter substrate-binding protein n=1 Tax=Streptomyces sp. NPDC049906 TaxID=3155656 RepID=UPI003421844B
MTEPLLPNDPPAVGGHRLLARLGAGGMGVVYLARAASGALAAVKVIRAEHADSEDFRARFRREADAARRVDSPWAVPVTGADLDAEQPWLATAFVPGPPLQEAVAACGPLPVRSVRYLAGALASALGAVHAAGLVHRDVKPGNVLLAVDGPRLIDFGIARAVDGTALTSADLVIGTPGFLAPEQARAEGTELGPASDVFALGCLLAYAATGRPPFGSGAVDALLYRTVHDEPDLDGIAAPAAGPDPEPRPDPRLALGTEPRDAPRDAPGPAPDPAAADLVALVRRCLAKDPAERPTAAEVEAAVAEDGAPGPADWLPPPVVRMIADRSAAMLALPDIEPTRVDPPRPAPGGRRRFLAFAAGGLVLAGGGGAGLWAWRRNGSAADGPLARRWTIGLQGDFSGPTAGVGRAQERAARLAVEQYNARGLRSFELTLKTSDDAGRPERAAAAARRLVADRDVLAVIGSSTDRTSDAALTVYEDATVPVLTVTNGRTSPEQGQSRMFLRARPAHFSAAAQVAYALAAAKPRRPGIIQDRAEETTAWMYAGMAARALRQLGRPAHPRVVPASLGDGFGPVVDGMLDAGVDAFLYCGPAVGAARLARTLAARRFTGPRYAAEPAFDPAFPRRAGAAAEGWRVVAAAIGPGAPGIRRFADAHRARFDASPGPWAAETYDAVNLVIRELERAADGGARPEPRSLSRPLREAKYEGVTKPLVFTADTGEFDSPHGVHLHEVRNGAFHHLGPAPTSPPGS